jgi:hypothetical protein
MVGIVIVRVLFGIPVLAAGVSYFDQSDALRRMAARLFTGPSLRLAAAVTTRASCP